MLRNILIWSWAALFTINLYSQSQSNGPETELLALEQKVYLCNNDTVKNGYIYDKASILIAYGATDERVVNEMKRVNPGLLADSVKHLFYWNAALIAYINNEFNLAFSSLSRYEELRVDSGMQFLILKTLVVSKRDTALASACLKKMEAMDTTLACLSCLAEVDKYRLKGKKFMIVSSAVIPGSGSIMNGNVLKGLSSLVITGSAALLTYYLIQNKCYVNAAGLSLAWGAKFYLGNIKLTEKLVEKREDTKRNELTKKCELVWNEAFIKYPLQLK